MNIKLRNYLKNLGRAPVYSFNNVFIFFSLRLINNKNVSSSTNLLILKSNSNTTNLVNPPHYFQQFTIALLKCIT